MIGLGLIPVSSLFFFLISLVFKSVAESACRFVLVQSGHSEYSELRLTDSGERGMKPVVSLGGETKQSSICVRGEE